MHIPGDPQKSVNGEEELNRVLRPKSQSFKSMHLPRSLSNMIRIFSGFKSVVGSEAVLCGAEKMRIKINNFNHIFDSCTLSFCASDGARTAMANIMIVTV